MTADLEIATIGTGATVEVFADIAHFVTNITLPDASTTLKGRSDTSYAEDCAMPVIETYDFGLGANLGAYVAFNNNTWGGVPGTSVSIYYTTLFSACAASATATSSGSSIASTTSESASEAKRTAPALLAERDATALTLKSATSVYTVTNVVCLVSSTDCPASLQSTQQSTKTSTYYSSVPSGSSVTFPATTGAVSATSTFGSAVNRVEASSGNPKSYVPTSTASSTSTANGGINISNISSGELSGSQKKLVIGLSVGIGGALLIGFIALTT